MAELTYAQVSELLKYDPETGKLFWLSRPREMFRTTQQWKTWNTRFSGTEALPTVGHAGYSNGRILGRPHAAHRVAWLLYYRQWPSRDIDHINGDKSDNRIANLRDTSKQDNMRNMRQAKNNTSGVTGVFWNKASAKWQVGICVNSTTIYLGLFETFEAAVDARINAQTSFGFSKRHGT